MSATPFAARLGAMMIAVVLAASCLTVSLDYLKFGRVLRAQEDVVYSFVSNDLASTIEDSMNLGLPMVALQIIGPMLQHRRISEAGTLGISVFDSTGTVRFDTDQFRVGSMLPEAWRPALPNMELWKADLPDADMVGARITNNFGQTAGGVVLRYDPAALETRMNAILLVMIRSAVLMLAICAAIAIVSAVILTRWHNAWFGRATAQLRAFGSGSTAFRIAPVAGSKALMRSVESATQALDDAEQALMRLGESEFEPFMQMTADHAI